MSLSTVQHLEAFSFPSSGNPSLAVTTPVTRGNLLVLQLQTTSNTPVIPDDGRNVWVPLEASPLAGGQGFLQAFWAVAESTRALTINLFGVTPTTTGNYYQSTPNTLANAGAQFFEITGNSITGNVYGATTATGTSAAPAVNLNPTHIGDMMVAFAIPASGDTVTEGSGFTNVAGSGTSRSAEYKIATATGSQSVPFVQSASGVWGVLGFNVGAPLATHSISGALGALGAGATVTFTSQTSGYQTSVTADASGNYTATLETDTWTVQPQLVGCGFAPNNQSGLGNSTNLVNVNFTTTAFAMSLTFTQLWADTMQRANENPVSNGGTWAQNGTPVPPWDAQFKIVSDEAVASNAATLANYAGPFSGDAVSTWVGTYLPAQQYFRFQVDALNPSPNSHAAFGLLIRASKDGSSCYFITGTPNGDGTITLGCFYITTPVLPVQPTNLKAVGMAYQRIMYWKQIVTFTAGDQFAVAAIDNGFYFLHGNTIVGTLLDQVTRDVLQGTAILYGQMQAQGDVQISNVSGGRCVAAGRAVQDVVNVGNITSTKFTSLASPAFPVKAGDLVVAFLRYFQDAAQTVTGVSDPQGSYTARKFTSTNTTGLACYSAIMSSDNPANVVTAAFSGAGVSFSDLTVYRIPGGGAFDNATSATLGTAGASFPGSINTTNASSIVLGYVSAFGGGDSQSIVDFDLTLNRPGGTPLGNSSNGGYCSSAWQTYASTQSGLTWTATFGTGQQPGSFKGDMILAAFAYSAGDVYDPTIPFLGSVRIAGSAPAGVTPAFLGTYKVLAAAPAGAANPYLGNVVVGSPAPGDSNPDLGQVVVVGSAPAGAADNFLGAIVEG